MKIDIVFNLIMLHPQTPIFACIKDLLSLDITFHFGISMDRYLCTMWRRGRWAQVCGVTFSRCIYRQCCLCFKLRRVAHCLSFYSVFWGFLIIITFITLSKATCVFYSRYYLPRDLGPSLGHKLNFLCVIFFAAVTDHI